ncbi:pilus assembly protein [Micromonospora sp. MSM11]|nr:TadE/TadG family type IV pilus assembly protein [Micromonospora sp. MSM11]MCL7455971.1 pilus assembly protein [Micromonospora sp. MSM11]
MASVVDGGSVASAALNAEPEKADEAADTAVGGEGFDADVVLVDSGAGRSSAVMADSGLETRPSERRSDECATALSRRLGDDDGRVTIWFAVLTPALLALIGLVVDGGAKVRAYQRADNIAAEAARAGGQAIKAGQAIDGGTKEIDPSVAATAVQAYLDDLDGVTGTVTVDGAQQLTVTVTVTYNPILLDLFGGGVGTTATGRATATLIAQ